MSEPPKKKRRSKWGIKPEDMVATSPNEPTPTPQGPKAAEAAAAKINAMLAAQGKLVKSDPPPYRNVLTSTTTPPFSNTSSATGLLSTPFIPPNSALSTGLGPGSHPGGGPYYVQDKVFVGMAKAPSTFNVREKLEGPNGSFLSHIATQTGAKVFLRGQGSGYIEPTSKKESFESLHIYISHSNQKGLESARKLCESLIETVQKECDNFVSAQQGHPPLGFGGASGHRPQAPYINLYQYPTVPGGHGPPPPLMPQAYRPGPQPNYYHGPPGPGYSHPPPPHPSSFHHPSPPSGPLGPRVPGPPQGYYGVPRYPPLPHDVQQAPEVPDAFLDFKRHDCQLEPTKRKFSEITVSSQSTNGGGHFNTTHFSNNGNAGKEGSSSECQHKGEDPGYHQNYGGDKATGVSPTGGQSFKEPSKISSRHFVEAIPSSSAIKDSNSRSFKETPTVLSNGRMSKNEHAVGKWQSLALSNNEGMSKEYLSKKSSPPGGEKDELQGTTAKSDSKLLDSILMPPPSLPGNIKKSDKTAILSKTSKMERPIKKQLGKSIATSNTVTKPIKPVTTGGSLPSINPVEVTPPSDIAKLKPPVIVQKPVSLVSYGLEDSDSDNDV